MVMEKGNSNKAERQKMEVKGATERKCKGTETTKMWKATRK